MRPTDLPWNEGVAPPVQSVAPPPSDLWYVTRDGKSRSGPYSAAQLQEFAKANQLLPTDLVWKEGMVEWMQASGMRELFPATKASPTPPLFAGPTPPAVVAASPVKSGPGKWYNQWWFRISLATLVLIAGLLTAFNRGSRSRAGTITFATHIDPKTLRTTNEGTRFTTGQVWMIVRGKKAFGDSKLIMSGRIHGTEAWAVIGEDTVDPTWDIAVIHELLDVPGRFDIKVNTSKGTLVAQSTVEIVPR